MVRVLGHQSCPLLDPSPWRKGDLLGESGGGGGAGPLCFSPFRRHERTHCVVPRGWWSPCRAVVSAAAPLLVSGQGGGGGGINALKTVIVSQVWDTIHRHVLGIGTHLLAPTGQPADAEEVWCVCQERRTVSVGLGGMRSAVLVWQS